MMKPDFPMRPPMREAWQRRRKATWPGGMKSGGCGGLIGRLGAAALLMELGSCIIGSRFELYNNYNSLNLAHSLSTVYTDSTYIHTHIYA